MKILDATTIIAFLNEMNYPDGLVKLSKHYEIVIPEGVVNEIKKTWQSDASKSNQTTNCADCKS